jgi:adenylate kinase family enzyme
MVMKKINVVGTSATGKSTFSRALAEKLDLHYIELDNLFWLDDWQECPDEVFFAKIESEVHNIHFSAWLCEWEIRWTETYF